MLYTDLIYGCQAKSNRSFCFNDGECILFVARVNKERRTRQIILFEGGGGDRKEKEMMCDPPRLFFSNIFFFF